LLSAFRALDTSGAGFLRFPQFFQLIKHRSVRPDITYEHAQLLYTQLDSDASSRVTPFEFFQLPDILAMQLDLVKDRQPILPGVFHKFYSGTLGKVRRVLRTVVHSAVFRIAVLIVIVFNVVILCLHRRGMSTEEENTYAALDLSAVIFFSVEIALKMFAFGIRGFFELPWHRFDTLIVVLGWINYVVQAVVGAEAATWIVAFRVLRLMRLFRILRFMKQAARLRVLADTFRRLWQVAMVLILLLLAAFYTFAVIGMEAFATEVDIPECRTGNRTLVENNADGPFLPMGCTSGFDTAGLAFLTLYQMLLATGWDAVFRAAAAAVGTNFVIIYFIGFYFSAIVILLNVLLALILETFEIQKQKLVENFMVEIRDAGPEVGRTSAGAKNDETERYRVRRKRVRRWSRELFMKDRGQVTNAEMAELNELGKEDLAELRNIAREHGDQSDKQLLSALAGDALGTLEGAAVRLGAVARDERGAGDDRIELDTLSTSSEFASGSDPDARYVPGVFGDESSSSDSENFHDDERYFLSPGSPRDRLRDTRERQRLRRQKLAEKSLLRMLDGYAVDSSGTIERKEFQLMFEDLGLRTMLAINARNAQEAQTILADIRQHNRSRSPSMSSTRSGSRTPYSGSGTSYESHSRSSMHSDMSRGSKRGRSKQRKQSSPSKGGRKHRSRSASSRGSDRSGKPQRKQETRHADESVDLLDLEGTGSTASSGVGSHLDIASKSSRGSGRSSAKSSRVSGSHGKSGKRRKGKKKSHKRRHSDGGQHFGTTLQVPDRGSRDVGDSLDEEDFELG
jgi:Ion transport protein